MMFWFNRHRRLRDQLSAYIDGELDASAVERLERHLAACGRCRQEMEQLRATVAALQGLPAVDLPRSFTLSPERAALRPPMPVTSPLAFGARIAAAGVAATLAVVLVVDLGDFGGNGVTEEATAPQMMRSNADENELGAASGAAATTAGEEAEIAADDEAETLMRDAETDQVEEPPPAEGGLAPTRTLPSPIPTVPPDATVVPLPRGEEPAPFPGGLTPEPEAGIIEALPAAQAGGDGGIDALTVVEIGLAAALAVLVAGSLFLTFVGRRR
ncbi:MAG: zf-HC2 domain-containing protein [Chloroflexi bacterium]|nr:zf-HC2 domain-containing protein [Chloroflexota bacterium]